MPHQLRFFVDPVDGSKRIIHHSTDDPTNDEPGDHLKLVGGQKLSFKCRDATLQIRIHPEATTGDPSPFLTGEVNLGPFAQNQASQQFTIKAVSTSSARYQYSVTIGSVAIDPEIIIDNTSKPVGPHKRKRKKPAAKKAVKRPKK